MIEIAHTSMVICEGSNWQASLKNYFPTLSVASIP
jgi:hypothetical protein